MKLKKETNWIAHLWFKNGNTLKFNFDKEEPFLFLRDWFNCHSNRSTHTVVYDKGFVVVKKENIDYIDFVFPE